MTTSPAPTTTPISPRRLRVAGIAILVSTPISGLLSFAAVATIVGEERLEGPGGMTAAGLATVAAPAAIGIVLIALSFLQRPIPMPGPAARRGGAAALAAALGGLGLWSIMAADAGDASIGGGLLVLAALGVVAALVVAGRGRS